MREVNGTGEIVNGESCERVHGAGRRPNPWWRRRRCVTEARRSQRGSRAPECAKRSQYVRFWAGNGGMGKKLRQMAWGPVVPGNPRQARKANDQNARETKNEVDWDRPARQTKSMWRWGAWGGGPGLVGGCVNMPCFIGRSPALGRRGPTAAGRLLRARNRGADSGAGGFVRGDLLLMF